jgi:hypothetical protein
MKAWGISLSAIVVIVFATFVWPTPYRYEHMNLSSEGPQLIVRINRFTGSAEYLTPVGWHEMQPKP